MSIKQILVPIAAVDDFMPVAASAIMIAKMFNSHVRFVYQRDGGEAHHKVLNSFGALSMSQFNQLLEFQRDELEASTHAVHDSLGDLVQRHGLAFQGISATSTRPSASWCETQEPIADVVAHVGGVSDLIVVKQPAEAHEDPVKTVVGAALFASGRPVLMVPDQRPRALDRRLVIGWNRSIQAGRAVSSAMPFLRQASSVLIVNIATGAKRGPSAEELADYLSWHGIEPEVKEILPDERRAVGEVLLDKVEEAGVDLLVMGAYSHSRLREILWGGVTKHVVSHARLPVLMAH